MGTLHATNQSQTSYIFSRMPRAACGRYCVDALLAIRTHRSGFAPASRPGGKSRASGRVERAGQCLREQTPDIGSESEPLRPDALDFPTGRKIKAIRPTRVAFCAV